MQLNYPKMSQLISNKGLKLFNIQAKNDEKELVDDRTRGRWIMKEEGG